MECFLQYLDDIDDLAGAFGLLYERIREWLLTIVLLLAGASIIAAGILLALANPPVALATCILMFVTLLYRAVTTPARPLEST